MSENAENSGLRHLCANYIRRVFLKFNLVKVYHVEKRGILFTVVIILKELLMRSLDNKIIEYYNVIK